MKNIIKSLIQPIKEKNQSKEQGTKHNAQLILWNDEVNTFDWVIESLVDICGHSQTQAEQCALIAHYNGKSEVKSGSEDDLKPLKNSLTERGLNVTIEKADA